MPMNDSPRQSKLETEPGGANETWPYRRLPRQWGWLGYAITLLLEVLVTLGLVALTPHLPLSRYPIPYVLLIMLVAYLFGEGPAILAFFVGVILFDYFFIPPLHTFVTTGETTEGLAAIVAFLLGTLIVGFATILMRRSRRRIEALLAEREAELEVRRRTEAELVDATWRLSALLENSPLALVEWDSEYRIVRWSEEAERLFGWTAREALGKRVQDLSFIYPDDLEQVDRVMAGMVSGAQPRTMNVNRNCRKDGSVVWCEWYNSALWDASGHLVAVLSTGLDITARKQAEDALEAERLRLRAVLQALPVGVIMADTSGRLVDANEAASAIWGGPIPMVESIPQYAEYKAWWSDSKDPVKPRDWAPARALTTGQAALGQVLDIQRFDGLMATTINSAVPIRDAQGRMAGVVVVIQDITELRRAQDALRVEEEKRNAFYRRTIMAATEGKLMILDRAEIEEYAGRRVATWRVADVTDLAVVRHAVEETASVAGMDADRLKRLIVCIGEATTNALKHAAYGSASLYRKGDRLIFSVTDHGPGIPSLSLPDVALTRGYSTAGTLGMGYKVMIAFADKVYLATGPDGTTVAVEMLLHAPAEAVLV